MDPLTHALAGAAASRVALARPLATAALLPGAAGALLPDADAFIRSTGDPLLYAEFHRHFTHALAFIPIGGALASLPWVIATREPRRRMAYAGAATVGYATHGLLDASTTYGTLLFWPFSVTRVSWDIIPIVDPLFTAVLVAALAASVWRRRAWPAGAGIIACLLYLGLGIHQRDRALDAQRAVAAIRGHTVVRGAAFPGFGSNLLWRSLYLSGDGRLHMDRLRVPWRGAVTWRAGAQVDRLTFEDLPATVRSDARLRRDFWRFWWFADGWVARSMLDSAVIGDARYSDAVPRYEAVWGVRFIPGREPPVVWVDRSRQRRVDPRALWAELRGADRRYVPVRTRAGAGR